MIFRLALLLVVMACGHGAETADSYAAWAQGRPQEAIAALGAVARTTNRWDAWMDLGLAHANAGDAGQAAVAFIVAHRTAAERPEPLAALRTVGATPPVTWIERLGPAAWPGVGWPGIGLAIVAGLGLGWAALGTRRRGLTAVIGTIALVGVLPGQIALRLDAAEPWATTLHECRLYDSAGNPGNPLPTATLVRRRGEAWSGRIPVELIDGRRGFVPTGDLGP